MSEAAIIALVSNKYVCANRIATHESWNELHDRLHGVGDRGPNPVIDWKRGPNDPVDPSKLVGTYTISNGANPGTITYDYGAGGIYTYSVKQTGGGIGPAFFQYCNVSTGELFNITATVVHC
jgi:hypothetical protein